MTGPGGGTGQPPPGDGSAGWRPWSGGSAGRWPAGSWASAPPSGPGQPYTGPPPTGRYAAPARVPQGPPLAYRPPLLLGGESSGYSPARGHLPPDAPPYDVPRPYLLLMRSRDWAWWRPVLGLLLFLVVYLVATIVVVVVAVVTGVAPDLALGALTDPLVLLLTYASLIVAIPIVWLCWAAPHGMRIGWSSSVLGRLRWRLMRPHTVQALLTLGVAVALTVVIAVLTSGAEVTGPDSSFGWLLLVVLLGTPFQAAAEEYFFRGYLSQAIAGWVGRPTAGAVVAGLLTATLFSLVHFPPDLLTFLSRFAVGLAFSAVVWLTGGLEAAIVLHTVNNVVIFVLVGLLGEGVLAVGASSTGNPLLDWGTALLGVLALAAFVYWVAVSRRRLHPELLSPALDTRGAVAAGASTWAPVGHPWTPAGPPGPSWAPAGPQWAPAGPHWGQAGPQWAPPGPQWVPAGPPAPSWVPPTPRGAPPPDERWARPAAAQDTPGGPPVADQGGRPGAGPSGGG